MSRRDDEIKPWKRLYHADEVEAGQPEQQQKEEPEQQEELTELQQQLLTWYRKTCLVAGAGMAGSTWYWYSTARHNRREIFLPPRAQALPPQVVEAWKKKAEMREALRTVGRHTLFITGVAALYFGVELGVGAVREQHGDWPNTAVAGAVAGGYLGARAPSSMRGRTMALGCAAGGMLGALSGWSQQKLAALAAAAESDTTAQQGPNNKKPPS